MSLPRVDATPAKADRRGTKIIAWEEVEPHYRSGIRSLADIGKEFGVSDAGIVKKARREGWTRDLAKKIAAKADAKVSAAAVSVEVSAQRAANQDQVVEANAELQYRIRMEHRRDIRRSRTLFQNLLMELESLTGTPALFERLGELLDEGGPDAGGTWRRDKLNELYKKVIGLTGRIENSKKLVEVLEKLVRMEREAFGIDRVEGESSPLDEMLKKLARERRERGGA